MVLTSGLENWFSIYDTQRHMHIYTHGMVNLSIYVFSFDRDVDVGTIATSTSTLHSGVITMLAQITNYMVYVIEKQ